MLAALRLLALDVGHKRIGVAVSDHAGMLAHPLTTIETVSLNQDAARIGKLCAEHEAGGVVVGLPRHANETESGSAKRARKLGEALVSSGISVDYMDEWGSSLEARDALSHVKRGKKDKGMVDQAAAVAILTAYLEARRAEGGKNAGGPAD